MITTTALAIVAMAVVTVPATKIALLILLLFQSLLPSVTWAVDCSASAKSGEFKDCGRLRNNYYFKQVQKETSIQQAQWESLTLRQARFSEVNMRGASLKGLKIIDSSFLKTNFTDALFMGVRFENVDFSGSDFTNAKFIRCIFRDVDLKKSNIRPEQIIESTVISTELPSLHHPVQR